MNEKIKEKLSNPTITSPLLVLFVMAAMQFSRYALVTLDSQTNIVVAVGVIQLVSLGLPCMVYYLLKGRKLAEPIYVISKTGPQILFVIFAAMFFVSGTLLIKFFYYINGVTEAALVNFYSEATGTFENTSQIEIILSFVVIPAVCEELFFRGIVFSEYRRFGTANAVIISALCFAMIHFSIQSFFIYLFAGLVLGFITAMTRSIIPSIALHLLSNTLSIYASDAFLRVTMVKNGTYFIGFVLTVLTAVSLILLLSRVESICQSYAERPPVESLPPKSAAHFTKVFLSPSFIILVAAFVLIALII